VVVKTGSAERAEIMPAGKGRRRRQCFRSRFAFFAPAVCDPAGATGDGMGPDLNRAFGSFTIGQNYQRVKGFLLEIQHFITPLFYMAVVLLIFKIKIPVPGSFIITLFYMFGEKIQEALLSNSRT
jgi:hypothetical protein